VRPANPATTTTSEQNYAATCALVNIPGLERSTLNHHVAPFENGSPQAKPSHSNRERNPGVASRPSRPSRRYIHESCRLGRASQANRITLRLVYENIFPRGDFNTDGGTFDLGGYDKFKRNAQGSKVGRKCGRYDRLFIGLRFQVGTHLHSQW